MALGFDTLGLTSASALALSRISRPIGLTALTVSLAGRYLSETLPLHDTMKITRVDGDSHPPDVGFQ